MYSRPKQQTEKTKAIRNLERKSQTETAMPRPYTCVIRPSDFPIDVFTSSKNKGIFFPRHLSVSQAKQQSSIMAVADHDIARNSDPGEAVTPMLLPSALMRLVTLEEKFVARLEARSRNTKAS
jgi:hypothetical protein